MYLPEPAGARFKALRTVIWAIIDFQCIRMHIPIDCQLPN